MPRARDATEELMELQEGDIDQALEASHEAGSMAAFYKVVGMRNPSRTLFVRHGGRLHSLKALATYALQQHRSDVRARDFHATDAARRLSVLKFEIVHNAGEEDEEREREWLSRLARPGQAAFRTKLLDLYGGCALTRCTTLTALEAAHVRTVAGKGSDSGNNGILLRADVHKLFDANLIAIDPGTGRVAVSKACETDYGALAKVTFKPPEGGPALADFQERWVLFQDVSRTLARPL